MAETPLVLVVDDEFNIRNTISRSLRSVDCTVETAASGEEALTFVTKKVPKLILLDMKMPGMSGLEFLGEIKEKEIDTRVIIITAYGTVDNAVEAMKLGAVDFLQKPFSPQDIRELVEDVLEEEDYNACIVEEDQFEELVSDARCALKQKNFDKAEKLIQKARVVGEGSAEAENLMGALYELKGQRQKAIKLYRAALSLDPGHQPSKENLERITELGSEKHPVNLGDSEERQ